MTITRICKPKKNPTTATTTKNNEPQTKFTGSYKKGL